jgi:hypothetical protein
MIKSAGAQALFEQFKSRRGGLIRSCVTNQWSEWLELDFKTTPSTDGRLKRDDRKSLGKELSAFANSQGGLIVWGVEAKRGGPDEPDITKAIQPIPHLAAFLADLEAQTPQAASPAIVGVQHFPIRSDRSANGFVVTYVPIADGRQDIKLARMNYFTKNVTRMMYKHTKTGLSHCKLSGRSYRWTFDCTGFRQGWNAPVPQNSRCHSGPARE